MQRLRKGEMDTGRSSTELYGSPIRPGLVPGTRLNQGLDKATVRKPTLASASAGFSKTTLLTVWIPSRIPKPQAPTHLAPPIAGLFDIITRHASDMQCAWRN